MLYSNRIIYSNNTVLSDISLAVSDYKASSETLAIIAAEDYLYIGGDLPFNHRYIDVTTANDLASVVSVSIWDGVNWTAAVDVIDETSVAGVSFARSGIVRWTTDRNSSWGQEGTTENISGLTTVKVYDMYWVRLSFSADLKSTTAINYVGHRFSSDEDLGSRYPDLTLATTKAAFTVGKTDWDDQGFAAAEEIILRLRKENKFFSANQILNPEMFNQASIHKVAQIIYNAFGDDYKDNRDAAKKDFLESFDGISFDLDRDMDGKLDFNEKIKPTGWVRR